MKKILIYNDIGTSNIDFYKETLQEYFGDKISVEDVDAKAVLFDKALLDNNILAFVMPGGAANPYRQKLKTLGNKIIREYVENGGVYLGICAGAYYACKDTEFEKGIKNLEVITQYGLDLINAKAKGTLADDFKIKNYTNDFLSAAIVDVVWEGDKKEKCSAYYHGGPKFELYDDETEVLARYCDVNGKPPALVCRRVGKGLAILSGVHFEVSSKHLDLHNDQRIGDDNDDLSLSNKLKLKELQRVALLNKVMEKLSNNK